MGVIRDDRNFVIQTDPSLSWSAFSCIVTASSEKSRGWCCTTFRTMLPRCLRPFPLTVAAFLRPDEQTDRLLLCVARSALAETDAGGDRAPKLAAVELRRSFLGEGVGAGEKAGLRRAGPPGTGEPRPPRGELWGLIVARGCPADVPPAVADYLRRGQ